MVAWRLVLFGGIQLIGQGRSLTRFRTRKTAALLALLALKGRAFSREELRELFWPDTEPEEAAHSLRQALSSLRQVLGEALDAPARGSVRLKPGTLQTDVAEFEAELRRARLATAKPTERLDSLRRALELQKNELLPELYEDWVVQERERLKALRDEAEQLQRRWIAEVEEPTPPHRRLLAPAYREELPLRQLPVTLAPFFGRSEECASILRWWQEDRPLLTVTGLGGAGKTRLALQAATLLADQGVPVVFVGLTEAHDAAQLYEYLDHALGGEPLHWQTPRDALRETLGRLPGRFLIVLDNLEHLLGPSLTEHLHALLRLFPQVSLLATSRLPLELEGEQELPLGSLTPDGSLALFVERAQALSASFRATSQNEPLLREICLQLGGIPLALEIAAAYLRVLTPRGLLELLSEQSGGQLEARRGALPERHRLLRRSLVWGLELLEAPCRAFFQHLAVFRGGWTWESAAAVTGVTRLAASGHLESLLRAALIVRDSEERFSFLVPVQEFAAELVPEEELLPLQERHAAFFLQQAELFRSELTWTHQETEGVQRLKKDLENLRAALRFLERTRPEEALRLAAILMRFWYVGGLWHEGIAWIEHLSSLCPGADSLVRLRALNSLGNLTRNLERNGKPCGADYYKECLALAREQGSDYYITVSLHNLVLDAWGRGELSLAESYLQELVPRRLAEADPVGTALTQIVQGGVLQKQGRLDDAAQLLQESLTVFRAAGNHWGIVCALTFFASLERERGALPQALQKQEEALVLAERSEDESGGAYGLVSYGDILRDLGRPEEARSAYEQSLVLAQRLGESMLVRRCQRALASL